MGAATKGFEFSLYPVPCLINTPNSLYVNGRRRISQHVSHGLWPWNNVCQRVIVALYGGTSRLCRRLLVRSEDSSMIVFYSTNPRSKLQKQDIKTMEVNKDAQDEYNIQQEGWFFHSHLANSVTDTAIGSGHERSRICTNILQN